MAQKVKEIIHSQGYRQNFIALRLGISEQYLSNLLAGRQPWPRRLQDQLSVILRLPVDFLFAQEVTQGATSKRTIATEPIP